jgi:glutathione S-transferase
MIAIHHGRRARSVRVIWLLEELQIPYELRPVEFDHDVMHAPEYLRLHPLGQVPVMQDGDITIFESGAIVEYLLARYGAGRLMPDPSSWSARAQYLQWFHFGEASVAKWANDIVRDRFYLPASERVPEALPRARGKPRALLGPV